jgi:protein-tyrosine phosphatase
MFWIEILGPGRLGIAARPRADDWLVDEIDQWRSSSVDVVVSLLEPHEIHDLGLEAERDRCIAAGITFLSLPIPDRGVPASLTKTRELVAACKERLAAGDGVIIHCRAGIGRSSMIAACVLVALGHGPDEAFIRIATARGLPVPDTQAQAEWAAAFTTY